jgi:hypothetical protein
MKNFIYILLFFGTFMSFKAQEKPNFREMTPEQRREYVRQMSPEQRKHGLDIKCCEEQIEIKPGELLIVDNIRAVHGRIGPRNPKEIYQFLFGIERVTPQEIAEFRRYIVNQLSKEISNP